MRPILEVRQWWLEQMDKLPPASEVGAESASTPSSSSLAPAPPAASAAARPTVDALLDQIKRPGGFFSFCAAAAAPASLGSPVTIPPSMVSEWRRVRAESRRTEEELEMVPREIWRARVFWLRVSYLLHLAIVARNSRTGVLQTHLEKELGMPAAVAGWTPAAAGAASSTPQAAGRVQLLSLSLALEPVAVELRAIRGELDLLQRRRRLAVAHLPAARPAPETSHHPRTIRPRAGETP